MLRNDETGASGTMVAFLVAGVLFVGSIGAVLLTTREGATGAAAATVPAANLKVEAENLAQLLLFTPGVTSTGQDWVANGVDFDAKTPDANAVTRLGLLDSAATDSLLVNYSKFQNLRRAPYDSAADGYVNYPEARASFGLDKEGLDFHVRAYPSLREVRQILEDGVKDPYMRVAYIGNITEERGGGGNPGDGLGVGTISCAVDPTEHPRAYRIGTTLTNGGTAPTQFEAIFDVTLSNGDSEYHKKNTVVVPAGATAEVRADVAATSGRTCAGASVRLRVYDSTNLLADVTSSLTAPGSTPAAAPRALVLETSDWNYAPSTPVTVSYSGKNLAKDNKLILTVCPGETECRLGSDTSGSRVDITVPQKEKDRTYTFASGFAAGDYTVRLYDNTADPDAGIETDSMRARNRLLIVTPAPGPYVPPSGGGSGTYSAGPDAATEVAFLDKLVDRFCPTWFDSTAVSPMASWGTWDPRCLDFKDGQPHPGDVYPQLKRTLKNELSLRLMTQPNCEGEARYDWTTVLIVGSNVDHNVLTSGDVKHCIEEWVLDGGTLIVLGSVDMNTHWLESVFQTALESSSGGLNVPDAGHPSLHVADDLDYPSYQHERAWRLKTTGSFNAEDAFTRVVNDATSGDAILAVGDPGAFQAGNVILSGWTPYDLKGNGPGADDVEGMKYINNLLMLSYRDLYLDYGPPIPEHTNVEPALARVHIRHPQFIGTTIVLDMSVYVFPGAPG